MNYQEPLKISSIDFSKMVYPKQRQTQNKKIILIKMSEKNRLKNFVFQTPTLLNINKPEQANGYAEIELAFVGKEQKKVDKFIKFLNDLETKLKNDAIYNASNWFNLTSDNDTINFQKIMRESVEYKNGTIKVKILKNSDFETILQLDNSKKIKLQDVPENSWCKMILEVYAVWINSNNDFGIFLRPVLISFTAREEVYNYQFVESDEEVDEDDIPDTEVNNNVFVKLETDIINQLTQDEDTTDINISILNNINLGKSKFSSSSSSEDLGLDAETSEEL
jgi:hypothetical protein